MCLDLKPENKKALSFNKANSHTKLIAQKRFAKGPFSGGSFVWDRAILCVCVCVLWGLTGFSNEKKREWV